MLHLMIGSVFIDRSRTNKTIMQLNQKVPKYFKEKRGSIVIFPEGKRNRGSNLLPFKKGVFHLALKCSVPIKRIVIQSYSHIFDDRKFLFNPGTVKIQFLDPIEADSYSLEDIDEVSEQCRIEMNEVLLKLDKAN
ncbi:MAG: 1-acylglycerol-3-phosphate O-acyltransferase [Paramarteilia canceri]